MKRVYSRGSARPLSSRATRAPDDRNGDIWIGRLAAVITATDDRIRQVPGRRGHVAMPTAAAPTLHIHRTGSGRLSRAVHPAPSPMRIGRRSQSLLSGRGDPSGRVRCHALRSRSWLLLRGDAAVRDRDRGPGDRARHGSRVAGWAPSRAGVRVIATRVSSSQPQLARAWPDARRGSGPGVSAYTR